MDEKSVDFSYGKDKYEGRWAYGKIDLDSENETFIDFLYVESEEGIFSKSAGVIGGARRDKKFKLNSGATPERGAADKNMFNAGKGWE